MASLYITEFAGLVRDGANGSQSALPVGTLPPLAAQKVTIGATSAQSAALNASTRLVRVHTDAICHIVAGSDPTATTSNARLAADTTEYFAVTPGHKLAVIAGS